MAEQEVITEFPDDLQPKRCPICSLGHAHEGGPKFSRRLAMFMVACPCGFYSKLFDSLRDLLFWFNTRGGKEPNVPQAKDIQVKHGNRIQAPSLG